MLDGAEETAGISALTGGSVLDNGMGPGGKALVPSVVGELTHRPEQPWLRIKQSMHHDGTKPILGPIAEVAIGQGAH